MGEGASEKKDMAVAAARALSDALHRTGGGSADAYELAGDWYVVTEGTGEGVDFAYDPHSVDVEAVGREGWGYTDDFCQSTQPCHDVAVASAYYVATRRLLGRAGACTPILSDEQIKAL